MECVAGGVPVFIRRKNSKKKVCPQATYWDTEDEAILPPKQAICPVGVSVDKIQGKFLSRERLLEDGGGGLMFVCW
ncbi:MAG: hypothetical protein WC045_01545 [Patescibacteria group bacterium]